MSLEALLRNRLIVPGILIILFWTILGNMTGDWKFELPETPKDIGNMIPAIIAAIVYRTTPLRNWANQKNHNAVNTNIRTSLTEIGEGDPNSDKAGWKNIKGLFYRIIDSDESLKVQAKRAYFNGLLWTSVADLKAISIIYAVLSIAYHFSFSSQGALLSAGLFSLVALGTWPLSWKITAQHIQIGDEQLDRIRNFHSSQVKDYFEDD